MTKLCVLLATFFVSNARAFRLRSEASINSTAIATNPSVLCPSPGGSFSRSCSNTRVDDACVVRSHCKDRGGRGRDTSMNMETSCRCWPGYPCNMDNIDGNLRCGNNPAPVQLAAPGSCPDPAGSFLQSCYKTFTMSSCDVVSKCKRIDQNIQNTQLQMRTCGCSNGQPCPMDNINGVLTCTATSTTTTTTTTTTTLPCYEQLAGRAADGSNYLNKFTGKFTVAECQAKCDEDPACGAIEIDAVASDNMVCNTLLPDALTIENAAFNVFGKVSGRCGYEGPSTGKTLDQFTLKRLAESGSSEVPPEVEQVKAVIPNVALLRRIAVHSN